MSGLGALYHAVMPVVRVDLERDVEIGQAVRESQARRMASASRTWNTVLLSLHLY